MIRPALAIASCVMVMACGSVSRDADAPPTGDDGPPVFDGPPAIDADPCAPFVAPPGSRLIHDQFCFDALGFNPTASPTTQTLACPGSGSTAGTYGLVRRPLMAQQANGCTATTPITRITAPAVNMALTQTGTGQTLQIAAGDRLRTRIACADPGAATCHGQVQITGRIAGGSVTLVYPASGTQLVQGEDAIDVDVAIPAALIGNTTRLVFIVLSDGVDVPDILFENPHLAQ